MHRGKNEEERRGFCQRLFRLVMVKLMAAHKEDKSVKKNLIKKESKSDVTIYFKQREDSASEDNHTNISRSDKERVIMLVNGSDGTKKMVHDKGKSVVSEANVMRPAVTKHGDGRSHPKPLLNDINIKSDAFIQSRLEKMKKSL